MVDQPKKDLVELDEVTMPAAPALPPGVVEISDEIPDDAKLPKHAVVRADGTIYLPLSFPVTLTFRKAGVDRDETFDSFVFHRLTGADMRVIQSKPADSITVTAVARSAKVHEGKIGPVWDRMDARDTNAAERCVMHFMDGGRPTGR